VRALCAWCVAPQWRVCVRVCVCCAVCVLCVCAPACSPATRAGARAFAASPEPGGAGVKKREKRVRARE
jgi:hypothetical protein